MILFVALILVGCMVGVFVAIEYAHNHTARWLGQPPPAVTEDDPGLIEYLERKLRHLED